MESPILWFGGKGHLTGLLAKHSPPLDKYLTYVEPFAGGASYFFAKGKSEVEVLNDKYAILVAFYKVLRDQPYSFMEQLYLTPYSRHEHKEAKAIFKTSSMTDIEKARLFFIRCRQSMSGDAKGGWSYGKQKDTVGAWLSAVDRLPAIIDRLKDAQIENLDVLDCIKKYDSSKTFFYVDPPYHHDTRSGTRYMVDFNNHRELLLLLQNIKGMFLLSGYHCPTYDAAQQEFDWHYVDTEVACRATPTTDSTGLKGKGALKNNPDHMRVEVLWWNDVLEKSTNQLKLFV